MKLPPHAYFDLKLSFMKNSIFEFLSKVKLNWVLSPKKSVISNGFVIVGEFWINLNFSKQNWFQFWY